MSGGGARAAYQVGFLKCVAEHYPDLEVPIVTGVSAGMVVLKLRVGFPYEGFVSLESPSARIQFPNSRQGRRTQGGAVSPDTPVREAKAYTACLEPCRERTLPEVPR